jgi:hypothetical protein
MVSYFHNLHSLDCDQPEYKILEGEDISLPFAFSIWNPSASASTDIDSRPLLLAG